LQNYQLVFGSSTTTSTGVGTTSEVKIFQYTGNTSAPVP
jgi:hypothetical protein